MVKDCVLICSLTPNCSDTLLSIAYLLSQPKLLALKGIVVNHIYPVVKAKLIKKMLVEMRRDDIPVYVGSGFRRTGKYDLEEATQFKQDYPMYEGSLPVEVSKTSDDSDELMVEAIFQEFYTERSIKKMEVFDNGEKFLRDTLSTYCPKYPIQLLCLGALHDLNLIPDTLFKNTELWTVGSGMECFDRYGEGIMTVPSYDPMWKMSPGTVDSLLRKLAGVGCKLQVTSIRSMDVMAAHVTDEIKERWETMAETASTITQVLVQLATLRMSDRDDGIDRLTYPIAASFCVEQGTRTYTGFRGSVQDQELKLVPVEDRKEINFTVTLHFDKDLFDQTISHIEKILFG